MQLNSPLVMGTIDLTVQEISTPPGVLYWRGWGWSGGNTEELEAGDRGGTGFPGRKPTQFCNHYRGDWSPDNDGQDSTLTQLLSYAYLWSSVLT